MLKKTVALIAFSSVVLATLAGCGSGSSSNGDASNHSEVAKEKLVIWTNMEVEAETIQEYATLWGEENGYDVEVIHQSPSVQKFAQAVQSPDGPDADIGIPNDQLADYINADLAAEVPADLYADSDFSDAAIQENEKITQSEVSTAFINQINKGEPMPTVSEMGQLWSIHVNNIRSMWGGELSPQEAAENIVKQLVEAVELMNSGK